MEDKNSVNIKTLEDVGIPYMLISNIDRTNFTADLKYVNSKDPEHSFEVKATKITIRSGGKQNMNFYKVLETIMNCCKGSRKFRRKAWDDHDFYKNAYICFEMDRFNQPMIMIHYNTNKANPAFLYNPIPQDLVANDWEEC